MREALGILEEVARVFWVYPPLIAVAAVWNLQRDTGLAFSLVAFAAGFLAWSLVEYAMHRFAFHGFAPHYRHHADPVDPEYIVAPLWLSFSAAGLLWAIAAWAVGSWAEAALFTAGVLMGYLTYEWIHLRIHAPVAGGKLLRFWRKHHYYHHFADERTSYGVTSPLWDAVFGSLPHRRPSSPAVHPIDSSS